MRAASACRAKSYSASPGSWSVDPRRSRSSRLNGTVALRYPDGREDDLVTCSGAVSAFAGFRFPPEVISLAVGWYLRYGLSYRDLRSCSPNAAWRSITSPSTGGCNGSPRSLSTPPGHAAIALVTGGSSTRPMSRSPAGGCICTGRSTSTARSSMRGCHAGVIWRRRGRSSAGHSRWGRCRSK
jgi:hypothetical protein